VAWYIPPVFDSTNVDAVNAVVTNLLQARVERSGFSRSGGTGNEYHAVWSLRFDLIVINLYRVYRDYGDRIDDPLWVTRALLFSLPNAGTVEIRKLTSWPFDNLGKTTVLR